MKRADEMDNGYHGAESERAREVQSVVDEAERVIFRTRARLVLQKAIKELAEILDFLMQLEVRLSEELPDSARETARRRLMEQLRLTRHAVAERLEDVKRTLSCYQ